MVCSQLHSSSCSYSYTVAAYASNHQLPSAFSQSVNFTTDPSTVPAQIANVHPTAASQTSLDLSWDPLDCQGAACTTLSVVASDPSNQSRTVTAPWSTGLRYQLANLTQGQNYRITLSAINAVGRGPESSSVTLTTTASNATAPMPPGQLSTSNATASSVVWRWTATRDDGGAQVLHYTLRYQPAKSSQWFTQTAAWATETAKVSGLEAEKTYCGQVSTTTAVANSSWSNASCVTLPTAWRPGQAELNPTATITNGTAIEVRSMLHHRTQLC